MLPFFLVAQAATMSLEINTTFVTFRIHCQMEKHTEFVGPMQDTYIISEALARTHSLDKLT